MGRHWFLLAALLIVTLPACNFKFTKEVETEPIPKEFQGTLVFSSDDSEQIYHVKEKEVVLEQDGKMEGISARKIKGEPILMLGHPDWKGHEMLVRFGNDENRVFVQTLDVAAIEKLIKSGDIKGSGSGHQYVIDEEMPDFLKKVAERWSEKRFLERK